MISRLMLFGTTLALALSGCSGFEETRQRQEAALAECSIACNVTGAWVFDDGASQWIADIWMEPTGIYARNRETDAVRFYKETSLDNYRHKDGEWLEFKTNDHMIRHLATGRAMAQSRLKS